VYGNPTGLVDPTGLSAFSDAPGVSRGGSSEFCGNSRDERCRKEATRARAWCSMRMLPSGDMGFKFFNCVNDLLKAAGCL
jgi:hypothetical protein